MQLYQTIQFMAQQDNKFQHIWNKNLCNLLQFAKSTVHLLSNMTEVFLINLKSSYNVVLRRFAIIEKLAVASSCIFGSVETFTCFIHSLINSQFVLFCNKNIKFLLIHYLDLSERHTSLHCNLVFNQYRI